MVPAASSSLTAARAYVRATSSAITSAEAAQLKKKDKGKAMAYDPKRPKKLTIFTASTFPAWQDKYIDLVRESFAATGLQNDKALISTVAQMGEAKKAMPFVQDLKRRLLSAGEPAARVFDRQLAFAEVDVLAHMVAGLQRITGCSVVEVVAVAEGARTGTLVVGDSDVGATRSDLPLVAESSKPGSPAFLFENLED